MSQGDEDLEGEGSVKRRGCYEEKKQTCRDGGKMALENVRAIETFGGSFEIVRKEIL